MAEKTTTEEQNPKNIMLVNPKMPGVTRRARKSELKWFAERGWKPGPEVSDQRSEVSKEIKGQSNNK